MPFKIVVPSFLTGIFKTSPRAAIRTTRPFWIFAVLAILALAVWANNVWAATASSTRSAITPATKLAFGTLDLEGTGQAIDSASAAKLLPLWQLLSELNSSSAASPAEITAVLDEIRLNMTPAQINAIDAMSLSESRVAGSGTAGSALAAGTVSGTQVASAPADRIVGGGMPGGGIPMDGGGPMPGGGPAGGSQAGSSSSRTSASSSTPDVIQQVILLLQRKIQG